MNNTQTQHNTLNLDAYEQDIADNFTQPTKGNMNATEESLAEYQHIAAYSVDQRKKKAINIRLGAGDIDLVKSKAKREGMPYQTLISSVIHKYATGRLIAA